MSVPLGTQHSQAAFAPMQAVLRIPHGKFCVFVLPIFAPRWSVRNEMSVA